jgi:hypothetical protein
LAAGDVEMEFVAVLVCFSCSRHRTRWAARRASDRGSGWTAVRAGSARASAVARPYARATALARRRDAIRRRRIVVFGGVARDHCDDAAAERTRDQRRVHLVGQIPPRELRESAGNVASEGTCERRSQPGKRRRMKLVHMPDPDDIIFDFRTMAERMQPPAAKRPPLIFSRDCNSFARRHFSYCPDGLLGKLASCFELRISLSVLHIAVNIFGG